MESRETVVVLRDADPAEAAKRQARWRSFQVVFAFAYAGVVLDLLTTAMGFAHAGSKYEQNPLGSSLIQSVGWVGLFVLLSALAAVCYFSVRVVCFHAARRWASLLTGMLAIAAVVRWIAVVTAILYLATTR